jgi:hypothetical protein
VCAAKGSVASELTSEMEVKYSIKDEARAFARKEREFSTHGIGLHGEDTTHLFQEGLPLSAVLRRN